MASAYGRWTVTRLKTELSQRGAAITGRKEALIERLEAYDRNLNFRHDIVLPEFRMPEWPTSGFKQLVNEHRIKLPKIDRSQVEAYFKFRVASDNDFVQDIKAIEKGRQLLECMRICACSVHVTTKVIHLTGIVAAAMKKKVTYNYKASIDGQIGEVLNTHCECPSGKGPHGTCKHLAAVLLMLVDFVDNGRISVRKSCTESSQTFHIPRKAYDGSPVKAECLPVCKRPNLDDPRPRKYIKWAGYESHVRNVVYNYCGNTGEDLTTRYLYPKADLTVAIADHDYLENPFTEYWVDRLFKVTDSDCVVIEKATRNQSSSRAWHEARLWRMTASRFGEIIKITPRRNKEKLCASLCNPSKLTCPAVIHGLKYEEIARKKFGKITGHKVKKCGVFILPEHGYLGATPDGIIDSQSLIEIKCPYSGREKPITPGKEFPYLEYKDGCIKLKRDSKYYCQVQGQLFLSKRNCCFFVIYTFKDLFIEEIDIDMNYCMMSLLPKLDLFYSKYYKPYLAKALFCRA